MKPLTASEIWELYHKSDKEYAFDMGHGMSSDLMEWLMKNFNIYPKEKEPKYDYYKDRSLW
jgi:hypothetical protein